MIWMSSVVIFCFVLVEVPSTFSAEVPPTLTAEVSSTLTASTITVSLAGVVMVDLSLAVISRISVHYDWKFYIKPNRTFLSRKYFFEFFHGCNEYESTHGKFSNTESFKLSIKYDMI